MVRPHPNRATTPIPAGDRTGDQTMRLGRQLLAAMAVTLIVTACGPATDTSSASNAHGGAATGSPSATASAAATGGTGATGSAGGAAASGTAAADPSEDPAAHGVADEPLADGVAAPVVGADRPCLLTAVEMARANRPGAISLRPTIASRNAGCEYEYAGTQGVWTMIALEGTRVWHGLVDRPGPKQDDVAGLPRPNQLRSEAGGAMLVVRLPHEALEVAVLDPSQSAAAAEAHALAIARTALAKFPMEPTPAGPATTTLPADLTDLAAVGGTCAGIAPTAARAMGTTVVPSYVDTYGQSSGGWPGVECASVYFDDFKTASMTLRFASTAAHPVKAWRRVLQARGDVLKASGAILQDVDRSGVVRGVLREFPHSGVVVSVSAVPAAAFSSESAPQTAGASRKVLDAVVTTLHLS